MTDRLQLILGRRERPLPLEEPVARLLDQRVLVTGASGSIGREVAGTLRLAGVHVDDTDLDSMDVRDYDAVIHEITRLRPTRIVHLAGDKHAPAGEVIPFEVASTNIDGTRNVLAAAAHVHAHVVVASTCKAADPETVYGATKLIAERMALQSGHSVARFFNVVETAGNVFELWEREPDGPVKVTPCGRYFMSLREAVGLLVWALVLPSGRYTIDPGVRRMMSDVAAALYPGRDRVMVPPRRGDRRFEPLFARAETQAEYLPCGVVRVESEHDKALSALAELYGVAA